MEILYEHISHPTIRGLMPQDEPDSCIITEADVGLISRMTLLHPVNIVARAAIIDKTSKLECRHQMFLDPTSRPDITWVYVDSSGDERVIAIMDFKNTNILHEVDFRGARIATQDGAKATLQQLKTRITTEEQETDLIHNGKNISKQLKKYYHAGGAPDVAVFDWKVMAVYDFSDVSENEQNPRPTIITWYVAVFDWKVMAVYDFSDVSENEQNPRPTIITWFSEAEMSNADLSRGKTFRSLTLGFLMGSLRRYGLV
ncbi:hypothetical protein V491_07406 [Pseudogymnoascus sp. VKM F-3775]|nr:hypothetical protein V491_07406 [Pseudogymnoascus sp. VKM F-3775]